MAEESFIERVRKAAELAGGQLELASKTGISPRTINAYALGETDPSRLRIAAIAKAAGVSAGWLVSGEGPMLSEGQGSRGVYTEEAPRKITLVEPPGPTWDENGLIAIPRWQNPDPQMFDYVPMAEAQLSAGGGSFVLSEDVEDYYAFRKSWLRRVASSPHNVILMRIRGNSMGGACGKLEDKDVCMVDIGLRNIIDDTIFALRVDHSIMIKRLSLRVGGKVLIISDNRDEYEPYEVDRADLHIIGQVIFSCRTYVPE